MNNSKSTRLRKFQTIYKALLRAAAVFLAEFYIMWTLYQFIFEDHDEFRTQKWISVAILTALLVYVIIAAFTDREELSRIRDFLRRQRSPEQILLILLLLWYMVSCAAWSRLDDEPYFAYNDNRLLIVTMSTFLFFPFAELMGKHARRIMEGMLHFTMLIYTPFCAYCICMYYNAAFFFFPSGTRLTRHSADVSMQMGANVNITAAAAVIMFGLSLYMILTKKGILRILYVFAAIVHFVVTIITGSRTSLLSILCFCMVTAFLLMRDILQNRERRTRLAGSLAAAVISVALVLAGRAVLFRMFARVYVIDKARMERIAREKAEEAKKEQDWIREFMRKKAAESLTESEAEESAAGNTAAAVYGDAASEPAPAGTSPSPARARPESAQEVRPEAGRNLTLPEAGRNLTLPEAGGNLTLPAAGSLTPATARKAADPSAPSLVTRAEEETDAAAARKMSNLSGRGAVWKAAVHLIFSTTFKIRFGVTPAAVEHWLAKFLTNGARPPHAHNIVLQVGCGTGVPGMLIFVLFLISVIRRCLVLVFKEAEKLPAYFWIIPAIIMAILVIEIAEAMIFAMVRLNLVVFYMLAGCCAGMGRKKSV